MSQSTWTAACLCSTAEDRAAICRVWQLFDPWQHFKEHITDTKSFVLSVVKYCNTSFRICIVFFIHQGIYSSLPCIEVEQVQEIRCVAAQQQLAMSRTNSLRQQACCLQARLGSLSEVRPGQSEAAASVVQILLSWARSFQRLKV